MKCAECSDRWKCGAGYDLRRKRRSCEKAKKPAKRSNADHIRSMTDKELAELLRDYQCNTCDFNGFCDETDKCEEEILEFLKQESEGE